MINMGFAQRTAEVGQPILTKAAILSASEAKEVNENFRRDIEVNLKACENDVQKSWHQRELDCAMRVEKLLLAVGEVSYFFPMAHHRGSEH